MSCHIKDDTLTKPLKSSVYSRISLEYTLTYTILQASLVWTGVGRDILPVVTESETTDFHFHSELLWAGLGIGLGERTGFGVVRNSRYLTCCICQFHVSITRNFAKIMKIAKLSYTTLPFVQRIHTEIVTKKT